MKKTEELRTVLEHIKGVFVGKDEIVDLMGICLVGRENLFMLGPPGTAKSALVRELAKVLDGKTFEYLLTRFTEPGELFGPFDIRKLREGDLVTNTEGMLPEANLIFLDELLNANSAILNTLLMVLNERVFRRGQETKKLPALMIVGASNHLPEDEALGALFDRFLIRVRCDYVASNLLNEVLTAGWTLESKGANTYPTLSADDIFDLQKQVQQIQLSGVKEQYIELIQKLRNAGVKVSDRRAVKLQRLIAASALISGREEAVISDLWVLRYIWDTEEQREVIAGIVNAVIEAEEETEKPHPQAFVNKKPDPDAIYAEVEKMSLKWDREDLSSSEKVVIKDRLRHLNGRCDWIDDDTQKDYVMNAVEGLWNKIVQAE